VLTDTAPARAAAELASVVGFLLQLGFRDAGRPAPIGAFSPLERDVASHLAQLGLLLPFKCAGGAMSKLLPPQDDHHRQSMPGCRD